MSLLLFSAVLFSFSRVCVCVFTSVPHRSKLYTNVTYGFPIPTPTIDSLALSGVALEQYYVHQLCSPTRTALLSGRYAYNIGMEEEVIVDGHVSRDVEVLRLRWRWRWKWKWKWRC